jgi:hypothetical protein
VDDTSGEAPDDPSNDASGAGEIAAGESACAPGASGTVLVKAAAAAAAAAAAVSRRRRAKRRT